MRPRTFEFELKLEFGTVTTSGGTRNFVSDDVDLVNQRELLEHCKHFILRHALRHLTYEQLHTLLATRFTLFLHLRH